MDNELRIVLQRESRRLLDTGQVDVILGFARSDVPWSMQPIFVFTRDDCVKLDISSFCYQNLAVYLPRIQGRVGIIAKPCDVRTIVQMVNENQVSRKKVKILSFRCPGMLDPEKLKAKGVPESELATVSSKDHPDALTDWCKACFHREPPDADFVGEPRFLFGKNEYPRPSDATILADELEKKSLKERRDFWLEEFKRCIRCKACMKSCPIYYGGGDPLDKTEFSTPLNTPAENFRAHLSFVASLAGRCTMCGACESACPVDIRLMGLHIPVYRKTQKTFNGFEPGLAPETYSPYMKPEPMPAESE